MEAPRSDKAVKDASPAAVAGWFARTRVRAEHSRFYVRAKAFYERHQRWAPLVFFFGGVVWDALTLDRIDAWFDNGLLVLYLAALGGLIVLAALVEYECVVSPRCLKYRHWYSHAIQFFLGALFSAYVIFYFQSATLAPSSVFLVILMILLVANEVIHRRLFNLYLLFALYFLASFSFFLFFIPVVTKVMNYATFLIAGLLSLGLVGTLLVYLRSRSVFAGWSQFILAMGMIVSLFGLLTLFYVQNWIPPVPLAMRYGGVFHHVGHQGGAYELRYEPSAWYAFWRSSAEVFHHAEGEPVYCFTAIFAPTQLKKEIVHVWSRYEEAQAAWVQTDRISYEVEGGRFGGYRGYTLKRRIQPGRWRVDVETEVGQLIGRLPFTVVPARQPVTNLKQVLYE